MSAPALPSPAPETVEQGEPKLQTPTYKGPNDAAANAVSFGFIATAILISIFLVVAIFERLLRPRPPLVSVTTSQARDLGSQDPSGSMGRNPSIDKQDAQKSAIDYTKGVSVIMPGQNTPSYIARPVPFLSSPGSLHQVNQVDGIASDVIFSSGRPT